MARRQVTMIRKDRSGRIAALCNPTAYWSSVSIDDAKVEIDSKINSYFVVVDYREINIIIVSDKSGGTTVMMDPDQSTWIELDELPEWEYVL